MSRHKVLLVEDNAELLKLLSRLLEAEGWEPLPHSRGAGAIRAIEAERPAAAVVDILLPDMLGYEVAASLRGAGVPFVFMSGIFKGGRAAADARVTHGAAGYFDKPFEAGRLLEAIRDLLPDEPERVAPVDDQVVASAAGHGSDFDVAMAVEPEESVDTVELTGAVHVTEPGRVSAVITGEPLTASGVSASRAPPAPSSPGLAPAPPPLARPGRIAFDEGELRDNLPDLVIAFWTAQQTGELALQRGNVKKALYFEKGRPCYAISNLIADRLAPFLVRVGKLTPDQLQRCQETADRTHRRAGDILVDMGLLSEAEKLYYVAQQVKAIAYSLFAWEDGRYRLHFTGRAAREKTKVDIRPAHLIARGVKRLYRPERLARLLADGDRLIPTQQPAFALHEIDLETWEAHLLPRVDGTRTVAELVALARRPPEVVRAALWALVALHIFEKR